MLLLAPCPLSEWSEWSTCEQPCSNGLQSRNRTCDCVQGCEEGETAEVRDCPNPCECVLTDDVMRRYFTDVDFSDETQPIGYIEKDNVTGSRIQTQTISRILLTCDMQIFVTFQDSLLKRKWCS